MNTAQALPWRPPIAWLVAAALPPLVLRVLTYSDRILDRDEAYWATAAARMKAYGAPLYAAGWDTKPPLVFVHYRIAAALAPENPILAAHVGAAVLAGLTAALVMATAWRLHGRTAGVASALLFALADSTGPLRGLAAGTETIAYVPIAALCLVLVAASAEGVLLPLAAGALVGLAAAAKQPAAAYLPAAAFVAITRQARPRGSWTMFRAGLLTGAGAALIAAAFAGWMLATGAWADFVACNWRLLAARARFAADVSGGSALANWPVVARGNPSLCAGLVLVVCAARRRVDASASRTALALVGPAALAGSVAAAVGGAGYLHYLRMAFPPLAVLAGVGIAAFAEAWPARRRLIIALVTACAGAAALVDRREQWRSARWELYDGRAPQAVAAWIGRHTSPDDPIFVWGMHPDLYLTARRVPATRFTSTGWLVGTFTGHRAPGAAPEEMVPGAWDRLFADLAEHPPAVVVDSATAGVHGFSEFAVADVPQLRDWLAGRYEPAASVHGYVLYLPVARRPR